jgi:hypothetical protein
MIFDLRSMKRRICKRENKEKDSPTKTAGRTCGASFVQSSAEEVLSCNIQG